MLKNSYKNKTERVYKKKIPPVSEGLIKIWRHILSRPFEVVPFALPGLTSLFEMGRGEHRHYSRHKVLNIIMTYYMKENIKSIKAITVHKSLQVISIARL